MHRIIVSRGEKRMKGKREGNQFDCLARFTNRIILVERTRHYEARKSGEGPPHRSGLEIPFNSRAEDRAELSGALIRIS